MCSARSLTSNRPVSCLKNASSYLFSFCYFILYSGEPWFALFVPHSVSGCTLPATAVSRQMGQSLKCPGLTTPADLEPTLPSDASDSCIQSRLTDGYISGAL